MHQRIPLSHVQSLVNHHTSCGCLVCRTVTSEILPVWLPCNSCTKLNQKSRIFNDWISNKESWKEVKMSALTMNCCKWTSYEQRSFTSLPTLLFFFAAHEIKFITYLWHICDIAFTFHRKTIIFSLYDRNIIIDSLMKLVLLRFTIVQNTDPWLYHYILILHTNISRVQ